MCTDVQKVGAFGTSITNIQISFKKPKCPDADICKSILSQSKKLLDFSKVIYDTKYRLSFFNIFTIKVRQIVKVQSSQLVAHSLLGVIRIDPLSYIR